MAHPVKVLLFDIETAPAVVYAWRLDQDYIPSDMVIHDTSMLTWSAKWYQGKRVFHDAVDTYEAMEREDSRIVESLANLLRECDIAVAHNINQFDIPMLNNRLMMLHQEPIGPVRTLDTLQLARKNFRLLSNKLDYLASQLGLGNKIKTDFELWRSIVERGDPTALRKMVRYNKKDVVLLEGVFEAMKPYVRNLPRLFDAERGMERSCPFCGAEGDKLIVRGYYRTQASTFPKYCCSVCGKYSRGLATIQSKKFGVHPL